MVSPAVSFLCVAVLRVFMAQTTSSKPYIVSLEPYSRASFRLPPSVVAALKRQLCGSMLVIKALHYLVTGPDARPRLNSTTPLLANLTTLEIGTICNNKMRMVRLRAVLKN
jgi:hypothetical protein